MTGEVLVVEPQVPVRREIRRLLQGRGYRVHETGDGGAALDRMAAELPDAVVLDVAMPASWSRSTIARIKRVSDIPVLMLARREQEAEDLRDLVGAVDDCVVGPVAEEMVGSLEAIIRRAGRYSPDARTHDDGWIAMDWLRGTASAGGRPLDLTAAEFALLGALVRNAGSVMATLRLAEIIIRRRPEAASPCQIRLCLAHVRAKIGPGPRGGSPIVTLPGYGYRYIAPVIRG